MFMDNDLAKLRIDKSHKARRNERSAWPWVLLVLLILIGGGAAVWFMGGGKVIEVKTVTVRPPEASATTGSDLVVLNATGYVMAAHKIELATKVIGRVAWVGVEMGDKIKAGQVLVRLEDDEYKARVAQQQGELDSAKAKLAELENGSRPEEILKAAAELEQAKAELANATNNYRRVVELEVGRAISKQEIDDAETLMKSKAADVTSREQSYEMMKIGPRKETIEAQRAIVRQLEGALAFTNVELSNTIIRSPIDGTVLARNVEVGEFVTTGFVGEQGAKSYVVSMADLNDLRVELDVSQNDFAKVAKDQPCTITTDAYPDRKYEGVVELISPEANRQKATVAVRVKVLKPDELLKPEMNATVSFLSPRRGSATQPVEPPAIRVPATAVKQGSVFVVENGKAVTRAVQTGRTAATGEVEIRKGLIGGEDLIVSPPAELKDGDKVKMQ